MPKIKFDHCVIHVSNWGSSHAFYRDVLGAEVISQGEGWAYRFGTVQLNCHGPETEAGLRSRGAQESRATATSVSNGLDRSRRQWRTSKSMECRSSSDRSTGGQRRGRGRSVYFRDPDGSLLELIAYPGRERP